MLRAGCGSCRSTISRAMISGLVALLLMLVSDAVAFADTVRLRNGQELSGYIVAESSRSVTIAGPDAVPVHVPRSQVEWLAYIGDAQTRALMRQRLLPPGPMPPGKAKPLAATADNRGYLVHSGTRDQKPPLLNVRSPAHRFNR